MARATSRDEGVNADPGGQSVSTAPNLGAGVQSSNAWMGIPDRVGKGTPGSRPNMSSVYGGDQIDGELFKGTSASVDSSTAKQSNAGLTGETDPWNSRGQYGPGSPNYLAGGYGSRENMTIGDSANRGELVGNGVKATPDADVTQYFISGKTPVQMTREEYLQGSNQDSTRNMQVAKSGLTDAGSDSR